jgi:uncharacterized protein
MIEKLIADKLLIDIKGVKNTIKLLNEGCTIPFISRYRKEATGSLDEVQVQEIKKENDKLVELIKRKEAILKSIAEQEKLTPELKQKIENCFDSNELEDIYLPYKPKRKTRASIAKEKGLEPLAKIIMKQQELSIEAKASQFLNNEVESLADALQGAKDIIAEWINENKLARERMRLLFANEAFITSKVVKKKEEEATNYSDYFDYSEPVKRCPSHRFLAVFRGEEEGFLKVSIVPEEEKALDILNKLFVKGYYDVSRLVEEACADAYKRLLAPSIENETRAAYKEKADEEAIKVFDSNLRQLLMAAPLGQKRVLAIDPGFRTGCKIVCLDESGNLLHNETIFPHPPQNDTKSAFKKISTLLNSYKIDAIAIGNGTASRETEAFIKKMKFDTDIMVFMVNEAGASVYSASKIAREEFPNYDVTVRGAVSIGRRLMDPLAELVKIDPKSIGVGQYQHAVDQGKLKNSLDQTVESSVNAVGVNLNTASKHLLTYVSGLGAGLAQNIVDFRTQNGAFKSRGELKKVPRLGDKAYEQSAGFLRIKKAKNPLDDSAVHPESYNIVQKMAKDLGVEIADLLAKDHIRKQINIANYVSGSVGIPTLKDIISELEKPGVDPRDKIEVFEFDTNIRKIEDLHEDMVLPGIVTNITNFGAFVDIGLKENGLVHISNLANQFISNPHDVVKLNDKVKVKVISVDYDRKRIQLSMKDL